MEQQMTPGEKRMAIQVDSMARTIYAALLAANPDKARAVMMHKAFDEAKNWFLMRSRGIDTNDDGYLDYPESGRWDREQSPAPSARRYAPDLPEHGRLFWQEIDGDIRLCKFRLESDPNEADWYSAERGRQFEQGVAADITSWEPVVASSFKETKS